MASSAQTQHSLYFFSTQGYPCGFSNFDEWQHDTSGYEEYPQSSNRISPLDTALRRPPSLSSKKRKATTATSETGFIAGYTGDEHSPDVYIDAFIGWNDEWNDEWTPRKRSATLTDHQKEDNDTVNWTPKQDGMRVYPSSNIFNAFQEFGGIVQPNVPGLDMLDDITIEDQHSLLSPAAARPPPLNSDGSLVDQAQPHGISWLDTANMMLVPTALPIAGTHNYTYEPGPLESISSYYTYPPSQIAMSFGESTHEVVDSFALNTNDFASGSYAGTKSETLQVYSDTDNSLSTIVQNKAPEQRILLPLPPSLDATTTTISDIAAQSCLAKRNRRRSFTSEERLATAEVRKIGSCEKCKITKTRCTRGLTCGPCRQKYPHKLIYEIPCHREQIDQDSRAFFPSFVTAHFEKSAIQDEFRNIQVFNTAKRVQMSLAPSYPQFSVDICGFLTEKKNLSHVADLASTTNDKLMSFTSIPTLQYVVPEAAIGSFKQACWQYVDDINDCFDKTLGNSDITRAVFNATRRLHGANKSGNEDILLRDILRIITAYHLLARRHYFVEDPRLNTSESPQLQSADPALQYLYTSKLVNIQFKAAMHELIKELLPRTLLELEERLRNQKEETWASCLCAILLISTCIEEIQIVADAFIPTRLSNNEGDPASIRRHGREICNVLEKWILGHLQLLTNGVLNNIAKKHPRVELGVVLDTGAETFDSVGRGGAEATLARDLRHICDKHDKELRERGQDDRFGGLSLDVGQNKEFRKSNRARLASKALLSWESCMYPAEAPPCDPSLLHAPPEK